MVTVTAKRILGVHVFDSHFLCFSGGYLETDRTISLFDFSRTQTRLYFSRFCVRLTNLLLKSESLNQELESIRTYLCDLINEPIYLKNTDKDGFFFETTKKRGTKIAKQLKENNITKCH